MAFQLVFDRVHHMGFLVAYGSTQSIVILAFIVHTCSNNRSEEQN